MVLLTVDFALGLALERDATEVIERGDGWVIGNAHCPLGNSEFSSQLLSAQSAGAEAIGLASVGRAGRRSSARTGGRCTTSRCTA